MESQAQFVGDYAEEYFKARYGGGFTGTEKQIKSKKENLLKMANIMSNSGFQFTEAVKWVLENY
ncbi:MAG: hypothetical protein J6Y30_05835 [Treponema sp.]|nr:hypothetical protein [Treponema sp.]